MRTLTLLLLSSSLYCTTARSQRLSHNEADFLHIAALQGQAADIDNLYQDIRGEAFFDTQWLPGFALTSTGQRIPGLRLKFDWHQSKFYANRHDTIYDLTTTTVTRCILYQSLTDTNTPYTFSRTLTITGIAPGKFVQLLAEGNLTLAKYRAVEIKDIHEDGVLSTAKSFVGQNYYYLIGSNNQSTAVKLNKKTLEKELADKWTEITNYAKEKSISFSDEEGWIALINYYNTLH